MGLSALIADREAGQGLDAEDAREARFRSAAEMVEMWRGLDLPAWVAPYALRDARLGYLNGYDESLLDGELPPGRIPPPPRPAGANVGNESSKQPVEGPIPGRDPHPRDTLSTISPRIDLLLLTIPSHGR